MEEHIAIWCGSNPILWQIPHMVEDVKIESRFGKWLFFVHQKNGLADFSRDGHQVFIQQLASNRHPQLLTGLILLIILKTCFSFFWKKTEKFFDSSINSKRSLE